MVFFIDIPHIIQLIKENLDKRVNKLLDLLHSYVTPGPTKDDKYKSKHQQQKFSYNQKKH